MRSTLSLLFLFALSNGTIQNMGQFNEFLQKLSSEPKYTKTIENHLEKWTKQYNARFDAHQKVNDVTGVANFACKTFDDKNVPSTVHALRPQDIKVIGALGDSLTAAMGAGANSILEVILEYRGLAFSIGGDGDLKYTVTLPNILRHFNPFLVGASHRVSPVWFEYFSQNNVAVSGSSSEDLKTQSEELVRRMKESDEIDFENDWKLVTVFIGSIDLCKYCENREDSEPSKYHDRLKEAIDILAKNLPRALISIVNNEHINELVKTHHSSEFCLTFHKEACPCSMASDARQEVRKYQEAINNLAKEYANRDDFTVVVQQFAVDAIPPTVDGSEIDLAFFAPDCFHFSHWGHSLVARALWNNMLEPVGKKTRTFMELAGDLQCPATSCPFIRTHKNSEDCSIYADKRGKMQMAAIQEPKIRSMDLNPAKAQFRMGEIDMKKALAKEIDDNTDIFRPRNTSINAVGLMIGLAMCVIVALAVGSISYNACKQRKRRRNVATENTPLLQEENEPPLVQVY